MAEMRMSEDRVRALEKGVNQNLNTSKNCAQTSFVVLQQEFGLQGKEILKALTPFPGIALRGETCGAVIGCMMALGLVYGREDLGDWKGYLRSLPPADKARTEPFAQCARRDSAPNGKVEREPDGAHPEGPFPRPGQARRRRPSGRGFPPTGLTTLFRRSRHDSVYRSFRPSGIGSEKSREPAESGAVQSKKPSIRKF